MQVIRTDKWQLKPSKEQLTALLATQLKYRHFVRFLITIVNTNWCEISQSNTQQQAVERLINKTKSNPNPKYGKFFNKGSKFYKFPSYLRRAAINDAIGHVSSFHTRYDSWLIGQRKRKDALPPKLTSACNVYPDLYKNQCIKVSQDFKEAEIKVFQNNDWKWITVPIASVRERHTLKNSEMLSPTLIIKKKTAQLSVPFRVFVSNEEYTQKVCGVDLGINTTAVCSIVDENGKVYSRAFIHDGKALDKRDKHLARVRRKSSCTMRKKGKLHKGFAKENYRKAANINKNLARQIARKIFNFAVNSKASIIGLENLKNWKPRVGKKKSSLKQRFQGWLKSAIAKRLQELAEENGISISFVYARSTSKLAYDGTGEVKRDSQNYALATFKSGKKYNADLNASYNIAARYLAYKLKLAAKNGELTVSKKSGVKPRSRVTLSALWVDKETATTALA